MELNREQIIKALECCTKEWNCGLCKYTKLECASIKRDTIALIKSYERKIKELTEENERLRIEKANQNFSYCRAIEDAFKEYNLQIEKASTRYNELVKIEKIKAKEFYVADTVKKMQSMIKERCIKGGIYPAFVASTIDQIAKEMLEGV